MRPRSEKILPVGYTVRLPTSQLPELRELANSYGLRSMNQLLANSVECIIGLCQAMVIPETSILRAQVPEARPIWAKFAEEDLRRTLPNSATSCVKITFPKGVRQSLYHISLRLRWAEGQFVLEALQAACELASSDGPIQRLPDVLDLYWGRRVSAGEIAYRSLEQVLGELSQLLGHIAPSALAREEKPMQPLINSLFSELDNYVPPDDDVLGRDEKS